MIPPAPPVYGPQHRLFTAVRPSNIPHRPEEPALDEPPHPAPPVYGPQHRLFTAVRPSNIPHQSEEPVLDGQDTQHRLFTAVRQLKERRSILLPISLAR